MNKEISVELFNPGSEKNLDVILEQYKLYVETANKTTENRQHANTFFLTINTALIGFVSAAIEFSSSGTVSRWIIFALGAGLLLSIAWYFILQSYRNLNSARYFVIQALEEKLSAQIYRYEWQSAVKRPGREYIRLSEIERIVPISFALVYVCFIIAIFRA